MWFFRKKKTKALTPSVVAAHLEKLLAGQIEPPPLSPWLAWLTIVLLRQHERQFWHHDLVAGSLKDTDTYQGVIPNMPGWTYDFHGSGCCLTSPTGELIDVDAHEGGPAVIDPWFFANRIASLCNNERTPEWQLWQWLPSRELIVDALADLRTAAMIVYPHGKHVFCLAPELVACASKLAAFDFQTLFNNSALSHSAGALITNSRESLLSNADYQHYILGKFSDRVRARSVLPVARHLIPVDALRAQCIKMLQGDIDATTGTLIEALRKIADDKTDIAVIATIARVSPELHLPYPAYQALTYLFERGIERRRTLNYFRVFSSVEKAPGFIGNPFTGSYAQLALIYVPEDAMGLVRRSLRSNTPLNVDETATLLAAIDQPWCHRELASALDWPALSSRAYIIEALRRSADAKARSIAAENDKLPLRKEGQIGYTFEEVMHNSVGGMIEAPLREAQPLARQLRAKYPATWSGDISEIINT